MPEITLIDETPTPPCEYVCNNPAGRCTQFMSCKEWRDWFATEWRKTCAILSQYTKSAEEETGTNDQETAQSL